MDETTTLAQSPITEILPPKDILPEIPPDKTQELRDSMMTVVEKDWPEIIAAQAELAKGIYVKEFVKDKDGKFKMDPATGRPVTKVYLTKPDKDAGQYLINHAIGKPKETTVIEGKVNFILDL